MPAPSRPRAPADACARNASTGTGSSPRTRRMRLTASAPSRSNSTAATASVVGSGRRARSAGMYVDASERGEVVDRRVVLEAVAAGQGVVGHPDYRQRVEARAARECRDFRRAQEARPVVRAPGQQLQHVFGAEDRKDVGLGVGIQGREHDAAAGLRQRGAGGDRRGGLRNVLEQLETGDDIETRRHLGGERLGGRQPVVDARPRFELVQSPSADRLVGESDADAMRARARNRLGEDAAAATDIDDALAVDSAGDLLDPRKPQWIDVVQRLELAARIPPAVRERRKLGELRRIGIGGIADHRQASRCCHARVRLASAGTSISTSIRSSSTRLPETQTSVTNSRPAACTRWDTGSYIGIVSTSANRTATTSACLPVSSDPTCWSRPSAAAPPSVAIRSTRAAGSAPASPVVTLASRLARRISENTSSRLFDAAPSVPSATLTLRARNEAMGATPLASFMFDAGQCTTWQPCAASSPMSSASTWTAWIAMNPGPVAPSRSSRASGLSPVVARASSISCCVSPMWVWIGRSSCRA